MRFVCTISFLLIVGTVALPARSSPPASQSLDPLQFFAGVTEGSGRLRVILSHARSVHVHGVGEILADGSLHLVQTVDEEGRQPTRREWVIRRTGPNSFGGTLSDARRPITASTTGERLHIRFRMAHGLAAEQWLTLQPGGKIAQNRMTVRKLGIIVATLDEQIVRGS